MKARLTEIREVLAGDDPKKFELANTKLDAARKYFDRAAGLSEKEARLAELKDALSSAVTGLGIDLDGDNIYAVQHATEVLGEGFDSDSLDLSEKLLDDREAEVGGALLLVRALNSRMPRASDILREAKGKSVESAVREAARKLVRVDDEGKVADDFAALEDALTPGKKGGPAAPEALVQLAAVAPSRGARAMHLAFTPLRAVRQLLTPETPADEIEGRLRDLDRRMGTVSFVLAALSGLVVLYVPSATWGSPSDYLKAFLWGSVVSEGTKAVAAIVAKLSPTTG